LETKQPLIVAQVVKLIRQLSKQLTYLIEEESCTIPVFHARNVVIINDNIFAYVGPVTPFHTETGMTLSINQPPTQEVHYKTSYFSFGLLILSSILGTMDQNKDQDREKDQDKDFATLSATELLDKLAHHPIKNTRIFWLLSRCFIEDPVHRTLLPL
jgi:hypothetical protein